VSRRNTLKDFIPVGVFLLTKHDIFLYVSHIINLPASIKIRSFWDLMARDPVATLASHSGK
jgi:hypothetical protein